MYVFESRVRYSEIGADGRLTTEKLIDYFQDCSTFQSEDLGAGVKYLRDKNLAWIIVYWRAEILRMPGLGADGERLANANSVWTLIDTKTSRPVRIPPEIRDKYLLEERIDMHYDSRKIRIPKEPGTMMPEMTIKEYHLDTNRHVNNGQYVRLAAGLLPEGAVPETLRIEYRRQAVLGDVIVPVLYELPMEDCAQAFSRGRTRRKACISLNAVEDGLPYAVLEIIYK